MNLLTKFWNWLTSSGSSRLQKAHPDLYPIDVDKLAKELRLAEEAKRLGEIGLPAANTTVITGPEAAIIQRVEKARQDYVDWGALRLNIFNRDLGRLNITKDINRARQADEEFERKASAHLSEQDAIVQALSEVARKQKAELDVFRTEHKIMREANYPIGTRKYLQYLILVGLVITEGLLNTKFFAQGLDSGLLGGLIEAGIMATINVSFAFLMGKFPIRYLHHQLITHKIFGFILSIATFIIMGCIALGISHYRDSLVLDVSDPAKTALEAFNQNLFHLNDVFSWALLIISLIFGVIALFDGLYSDDLYPGYGYISRRTQEKIDDHEAEINALRYTLEELKNEELKNLDTVLKRAQTDVSLFESLIHDKNMASSRLTTALRDADNSLDALIKKFRTENEIHRKNAQRPVYFDTQPNLQPIKLPDLSTATDKEECQTQRNLLESLINDEQEIRARIQEAFNKEFDRLKPLDLHFSSKEAL